VNIINHNIQSSLSFLQSMPLYFSVSFTTASYVLWNFSSAFMLHVRLIVVAADSVEFLLYFICCCFVWKKHFFNSFFLRFLRSLVSWLQTTPTLGDVYALQDFRTLANDLTLVREVRPTFSCCQSQAKKTWN